MQWVKDDVLSTELLAKFAARASVYDRENRFFTEGFEDLMKVGYLKINVPQELGGRGFTLVQTARQQRRLAYHSPAAALGIDLGEQPRWG